MNRKALLLPLLRAALALSLWLSALSAVACTERTMLELIGTLEAPKGYDQVYSGVSVQPPRPITTMTVGEVLEWQRLASKTSVSSAAGRYQVIRGTLSNMVDQRVVSVDDIYSPRTQDRIGLYLLRSTGYRNGSTSPEVANRVAGIWAALPQIGGPEAGLSVYEGYAGNHALVTAPSYQGVLDCSLDVANVEMEATVIRAGTRLGFEFDHIIERMLEGSEAMAEPLQKAALLLLYALAIADIVVTFGRSAITGRPLGAVMQDLVSRMLVIGFLSFIILNIADIVLMVANVAAHLAEDITNSKGISLSAYARAKTTLVFSFSEGFGNIPSHSSQLVFSLSLIIVLLTGAIMSLAVLAYARLYIGTIIGVFTAGLGGFTATRNAPRALIFSTLGNGLRLLTLMIIMHLGLEMAQALRGSSPGETAALLTLMVDIIIVFLCWQLPTTIARLTGGPGL